MLNFKAYGQTKIYKTIPDDGIELFRDLIKTINDTSFVISPIVNLNIGTRDLDIRRLTKTYRFTKRQLLKADSTMFQISKNKYFEIADADSMIKFRNIDCTINDSVIIKNPYSYFVNQTYGMPCICEFFKPIYSVDKRFVIAKYLIICGSFSFDKTVVLKKMKYKWKIIEIISSGIS